VIGGTSGLGLSAARAIAAGGGKVLAIGRDDEHLAEAKKTLGEPHILYADDAQLPEAAERAIARADRELGGCHGLYHVAGGSGRAFGDGPLHDVTDDGWRRTLDLNLTSLFLSNRAAVR